MAHCPECTHDVPAGSPVCTTCGASMPVGDSEAPAGGKPAAKGMDEVLLRGMSGFLVLCVILAAAFTVWSIVSQMLKGQ